MPAAEVPWGTSVTRGLVVGTHIRHVILPILWVAAFAFPGSLVPISAEAQTIALGDTVYRLSEILVEADRFSDVEDLRNRPAFITIIPTEESAKRFTSTAEYLSQTVSFHVKNAGGYGAYSTASVRGSSAKQVSVFIDGVPLPQAHSGVVDLADLPVSSLSRIEVYRGFGAFDLSGSPIGGAVNLVTRDAASTGKGRISFSYGSLSTERYQASYALSKSEWDFLAVGGAFSSEGNFEFLDDNGTPYTKTDDEIAERINNHLEARELMLKASHPLGAGRLVMTNQMYHKKQGLPGYSADQSRTEALTKTHDLFHLAWNKPATPRLPLRLDLSFFSQYRRDLFEDRRADPNKGNPDVRNRSLSFGGTVRWRVPMAGARHSVRGLLEARRESFRSEEILRERVEFPRQSRTSVVLTLEDEIGLWPGRFRIVPAVRYERHVDRMGGVEPGSFLYAYLRSVSDTTIVHERTLGSVSAVAALGWGFRVKGNAGRYYRLPTLMELFGYQGIVLPSPLLRPESGLNRDLGIQWEQAFGQGRFLSLEYAHFWSDVEDLVQWYRFLDAAKAVNVDEAEIEGYELTLRCGGWLGLSVSGSLTAMEAINTGPVSYTQGKVLPDRPELAAFGKLAWRRGRTSVFYELDYLDGNYWNAYNGVAPNNKEPSRIRRLHAAGFSFPAGQLPLDVTIEIKNITDEQVEDVMGYPLPGRSAYGTVVLNL